MTSAWSTEREQLRAYYERLRGRATELESELNRLLNNMEEVAALTYARRALEVIVTEICETELKRDRGTEPLAGLLEKFRKEKAVPEHIVASMHNLNRLGTFGAHPKPFSPQQVREAFVALATVIDWYVIEYKDMHQDRRAAGARRIFDVKDTNPYLGLDAFEEKDAARFFGRESLVDALVEKFRRLKYAHGPRLIPVVGPSGCGKSSLVRAGMTPKLKDEFSNVSISTFKPTNRPIESLARALAKNVSPDGISASKTREFSEELTLKQHDGIRRIADGFHAETGALTVLVIDQFEEIYTLCEKTEERAAFIENLMDAVSDESGNVMAILTLRSDFLGETQSHPAFNHVVMSQAFLVATMNEAELRSAIAEPAKVMGKPFDAAFVDHLIEQVKGREGALPLMQYALYQIWDGVVKGVSPFDALNAAGGVGGAMVRTARSIYDNFPEEIKPVVRRILLKLIRPGDGAHFMRQRVRIADLVAHFETEETVRSVLNRFATGHARLLTLSYEDGNETVEITHEVLIEKWDELREWGNEYREIMQFERRLMEAANRWEHQKQPDGLLWRSPDLDLLRRFHQNAAIDMTSLQLSFFRASEKKQRQTRFLKQATVFILALLTIVSVFNSFRAKQAQEKANLERDRARIAEKKAIDEGKKAKRESKRAYEAERSAIDEKMRTMEAEKKAKAERDNAFRTRSLFLADLARQENERGNHALAVLLAIEALPDSANGSRIPYVPQAEKELYHGTMHHRKCEFLRAERKDDWNGETTYLKNLNLELENGGRLTIGKGQRIVIGAVHPEGEADPEYIEERMRFVAFSTNGDCLLTADYYSTPFSENIARIWNPHSKKLVATLTHPSSANVRGGIFGPFDKRLATWSCEEECYETYHNEYATCLWDTANWREIAVLEGQFNAVFSPDGERLATLAQSKTGDLTQINQINIWDVHTGKLIVMLEGHAGDIKQINFSLDGKKLISVSYDATARIWDAMEGHILAILSCGDYCVGNSAVFSKNGEEVLTGSRDGSVRIWNAETCKEVFQLGSKKEYPYDEMEFASYSPAGNAIVVHHRTDGMATIWDAKTKQKIAQVETGYGIDPLAISPNGRLIAGQDWKDVHLWDGCTGKKIATLKHDDIVRDVAFSPDGKKIVAVGDFYWPHLWDILDGEFGVLSGHHGWVRHAAFSPDGKLALTVSQDRSAHVWDVERMIATAVLGNGLRIEQAVFSPDGRCVAVGLEDHSVRLWSLAVDQPPVMLSGHTDRIAHVVFSKDGKCVLTASRDKTARLWNAENGRELYVMAGHTDWVNHAEFSPDGDRIITASDDRTVRIWERKTGEALVKIGELRQGVEKVLCLPGGQRFILFFKDKSVAIRNMSDDTEQLRLEGHEGEILHVDLSPDGGRIVTASEDGTARIWNANNGELVDILKWHDAKIYHAAFSHDGRRIVTSSADGTARIWDIETGATIAVLSGHSDAVFHAEFSTDGTRVVTASADNTGRIWRVFPTTQALIDHAKAVVPHQLTRAERKRYFLEPCEDCDY